MNVVTQLAYGLHYMRVSIEVAVSNRPRRVGVGKQLAEDVLAGRDSVSERTKVASLWRRS